MRSLRKAVENVTEASTVPPANHLDNRIQTNLVKEALHERKVHLQAVSYLPSTLLITLPLIQVIRNGFRCLLVQRADRMQILGRWIRCEMYDILAWKYYQALVYSDSKDPGTKPFVQSR